MVQGVFASIRLDRLARQTAIAIAAFVAAPAVIAAQTTVTLDAPKTEINCDLTIQGGAYSDVNYQYADSVAAKNSDSNYTRRILLKFDTEHNIPAGAHVSSAKLYMVLKSAGDKTSRPLTAYRVTKSFHVDQATWRRYSNSGIWAKPGGDLGEKYTTTNVGGNVGQAYEFDLTQAVQDSVNGKFGSRFTRLALIDTGAKNGNSFREFHSTRASNASLRPKLVITYGSGSTSSGGSSSGSTSEPASASSGGTTLKVMQWNIHKTEGTNGVCNPDRTASWIVKLGAQVVSLNEVGYFAGSCAYNLDMGAKLQALVEQKSGRTWHRKFAIRSGAKAGDLILSQFPFSSTSSRLLSNGGGVPQTMIVVNGRNINIFSAHVSWENADYRTKQTTEVRDYASTFSAPRIVMGDFNTWPNTSDYKILADVYHDSWVQAQKLGTATSYKSGGTTHGASRFDYVYYSKNSPLVLKSVSVPSTATNGVYASDHDPVIAVFEVQ